MSDTSRDAPSAPVTPAGLNHLVINVRDLEESHRFWTEVLGFEHVGTLRPAPDRPDPPRMRFYSGRRNGRHNHHDIALIENRSLPDPAEGRVPTAINHIAVTLPDRESWLAQLAWLQNKGVVFNRRVEHGVTHSVYIEDPNGYGVELLYELPREVWEGDIDAALNYLKVLPTEGAAALEDDAESTKHFARAN